MSAAYVKVQMLPVQVRWLAHGAGSSGTLQTFHMPLLLALVIFPFHTIIQALDLAPHPHPQPVGTLGAKSTMRSSAKEKVFMHQDLAWDLNPTVGRCQPALGLRRSKNDLLRLRCPSFF